MKVVSAAAVKIFQGSVLARLLFVLYTDDLTNTGQAQPETKISTNPTVKLVESPSKFQQNISPTVFKQSSSNFHSLIFIKL